MLAIRIVLLGIGAALVCSMIRVHRPEIALMISIAVGMVTLLISGKEFSGVAGSVRSLLELASFQSGQALTVLKASGITILAELGVQICSDAGESALSGRIRLACRLVILGMVIPYVTELIDSVALLYSF